MVKKVDEQINSNTVLVSIQLTLIQLLKLRAATTGSALFTRMLCFTCLGVMLRK